MRSSALGIRSYFLAASCRATLAPRGVAKVTVNFTSPSAFGGLYVKLPVPGLPAVYEVAETVPETSSVTPVIVTSLVLLEACAATLRLRPPVATFASSSVCSAMGSVSVTSATIGTT